MESSKDGETRRKEKSKKNNLLVKNVVDIWISLDEKKVFEDKIEKLKHQITEEQQTIQKKTNELEGIQNNIDEQQNTL